MSTQGTLELILKDEEQFTGQGELKEQLPKGAAGTKPWGPVTVKVMVIVTVT